MEKQEKAKSENKIVSEIMENRKPNTILVTDFVNKYNGYKADTAKTEYLNKTIKVVKYVSYASKVVFANQIVEQTHNVDNGIVNINTAKQYALFVIGIISMYTNLEFSDAPLSDYDLLDELGLIEVIIGMIPDKEYQNTKLVLDMVTNDFMTNNYGTVPLLQKLVASFIEFFSPVLDNIRNMDNDTLTSIVEKLK